MFFGDDESDTHDQKSEFEKKFGVLSKRLCEVVDKFSMIGFTLLDINDKFNMCNIIMMIDKSNGYFYHPEKVKNKKEQEIDYEQIE